MLFQEIRHAGVGVNLVFAAGEAVAFVFVNFEFGHAAAFMNGVSYLLRL